MLVCHCKAVNDRTIREAVRGGAHTARHVARACGAGSCCGGCRPTINELIGTEALTTRGTKANQTVA